MKIVLPFFTKSVVRGPSVAASASSPTPLTLAFVTPGIGRVLRVFQSPGGEYRRVTISFVGLLAVHEHVFVLGCCPAATVSPSAALTWAGVTCAHGSLGTCASAARRPDATSTDTTTGTSIETKRA